MGSENSSSRILWSRLGLAGAAALFAGLAGCGGYGDDNGCYDGCNFGPPVTVNVPNSIAIADVNGDGVPDLLVAKTSDQGGVNNPGFANVILGVKSPAGTFDSGVQYSTTGFNPSGIVAADLMGVDAFDQPAVEEGKVLARDYLRAT